MAERARLGEAPMADSTEEIFTFPDEREASTKAGLDQLGKGW